MRPLPRDLLPLALVTPWAVWAGLRATGTERGFPGVPAISFTPYAAASSVLPLGIALARRSRPATALAAVATGALTTAVLGRRGTLATPTGPRPLRLATVNLLHGRADAAGVVALVRDHDLDVLALQEVTPEAEAGLRGAGIGDLLPHDHVLQARPGNPPGAGGAVWSRHPVLARGAVPGRFDQPWVRLAVPGGPDVEVTAVHAQPPDRSRRAVARWVEDLDALPDPGPDVVRVLAGDYNATLDHAGFRALLARGYVDAARAAGQGLSTTWTPQRAPHPQLTIDHVLVDRRVGVRSVRVRRVLGSDHRAVVAELTLPAATD